MKKIFIILSIACMAMLTACNVSANNKEETKLADKATIVTNYGEIKVELYPEIAPKAVENFVTHASDGYYDGVIFHRVIEDFMIQGGDPEGTGRGGESIWGEPFEDEFDITARNYNGALSMANSGTNTNGSQFFIVQNHELAASLKTELESYLEQQDMVIGQLQDGTEVAIKDYFPTDVINEYLKVGGYPSLDFKHTVFGRVTEGMDVVDNIAAVQTNGNDKPIEDVIIETIKVGE